MKSWLTFQAIQHHAELKMQFDGSRNQKELFAGILVALFTKDAELDEILVNCLACDHGHAFARSLSIRFFNLFMKNLMS